MALKTAEMESTRAGSAGGAGSGARAGRGAAAGGAGSADIGPAAAWDKPPGRGRPAPRSRVRPRRRLQPPRRPLARRAPARFACRNRLDFTRAAELCHAIAGLAALHDAPRDRAEALVGLGQSLIALGRGDEAMAALTTAQTLAPGDTLTWKDATAAVVAGHLATGDADAALTTARDAAIALAGLDDARGDLEAVGLVVHLHRIRGEHAVAYRALLGIYGLVQQRYGEAATAPIKALIDQLQADVGAEKFDAMATALLAELQAEQAG
ncbi:MAG: hypothetical protein R3F65_08335 [bacterium]